MKAIHLSVKAGGGAGIAARRSVEALREQGVDAELWTSTGEGAASGLRSRWWALWRARLASIPTRLHTRRRLFSVWSNSWLPSRIAPRIRAAAPDIVHLHWIGDGFLDLGELGRFGAPVVWTLHDAWAFTGGCHYPGTCTRFREGCGRCPQLGSKRDRDLSARNLVSKRDVATAISRWITPSHWLADHARNAAVVSAERIRVVPNGLSGNVFNRSGGSMFRRQHGLPKNAAVLVAGAEDVSDRRKGAAMLPEAVASIQTALGRKCVLIVFGRNSDLSSIAGDVEIRSVGELHEEAEIAAVLSGADALLLASMQDNLPNIAVEAQACGCPVVGFDSGGLREIIEPGATGALADEKSASGLANATAKWLLQNLSREQVAARCRMRFEERFTYEHHSRQILAVYNEVLGLG